MIKKLIRLSLKFTIFFLIFSCTHLTPFDEFEKKLLEFVETDNKIDQQELKKLFAMVVAHQTDRSFRGFLAGNTFDQHKLETYIRDMGYVIEEKARPEDLTLNIYIENSGSMNGYVSGRTQFKDALQDLVVMLKYHYGEERVNIFFINSAIHPTGIIDELTNIPHRLNPKTFHVGNTASSNLNSIFSQILEKTSQDTLSLLLSDCIYSIDGKNTNHLLNQQKSLTKSAFLSKFKTGERFSTAIVRLNSVFNGTYYDRNSQKTQLENDSIMRPYYLTIIGEDDVLADFHSKIELVQHKMEGFENKYTFSVHDYSQKVHYSPMMAKTSVGRWNDKGRGMQNIRISNRTDDPFTFYVVMNLAGLPITDEYLSNTAHYHITEGNYKLLMVSAYDKDDFTVPSLNRMQKLGITPTHSFVFQATTKNYTNLAFSLTKEIPQWIIEAHTDDDTDIHMNLDKTFGIRYMAEGIAEAYETVSAAGNHFFEANINISK